MGKKHHFADMPGATASRQEHKSQNASSAKAAILQALSENKYDFRTVHGIAKSTGLSPEKVTQLLGLMRDQVRTANVTDSRGNLLYTLKTRRKKFRERMSELRSFMAASTGAGID